jgi:hypothetical protein
LPYPRGRNSFIDLSDKRFVLLHLERLKVTQRLVRLVNTRVTLNEPYRSDHVRDDFLPRLERLDNLIGAIRSDLRPNVSLRLRSGCGRSGLGWYMGLISCTH